MTRTKDDLLQMKRCKDSYCFECMVENTCYGEKYAVSELAADLLDSRAIIEKQKELIKEMRELIKDIKYYGLSISRSDRMTGMLERAKDYA